MPTPRWHQPCRRILADATPCEESRGGRCDLGERLDTTWVLRKESHQEISKFVALPALFVTSFQAETSLSVTFNPVSAVPSTNVASPPNKSVIGVAFFLLIFSCSRTPG